MELNNIIGNKEVKDYLSKSVNLNNLLHSYLFLGTEGIGKLLIAKEFAKKILCLTKEESDCNCKSCICFDTVNHPDFNIINGNGDNSSIKIEQIREMIAKTIEKPIISQKKVYIINDCHKMTKEAQNCLLKTLEEPPEFIIIILISSNENFILNTIKSRCMSVKFENIPDEELRKYAVEKLGYSNLTDNILKTFEGSIEKAIRIKENEVLYKQIENIVTDFTKKDLIDIMLSSQIMYDKDNIYDILNYIIVCLYSKGISHISCIGKVNKCIKNLKGNANFEMSIDTMLFEVWEELNEKSNRY